jgi:hypothetical protein
MVMVTKQLSIAIAIAISICIGSGIALETLAAAPASPTGINFDQVFADVTRQSVGYVDRARKSNRLPSFKTVLPEPALLPYCGIRVRRSYLGQDCWSLRRLDKHFRSSNHIRSGSVRLIAFDQRQCLADSLTIK